MVTVRLVKESFLFLNEYHMILIIRCNAISNDPRVKKYLSYFDSNNIDYRVLGWDRNGEDLEYKNSTFFRKNSGYNVGGLNAAWNRVLWMWFCFTQIRKIKPSFIHGCDLDSAFPAVMYKVLCNRKTNVLFDVFDWFSATLYNQPKIITTAFKWMESFTTKYSNHIIICEKERLEQIPYDISSKVDVLPNIPMIEDETSFKYRDESLSFPNDNITISYVGGLYNERFIDELLDIAEKGNINLLIAGYGDARIENRCKKLSKLENVKYFGGVPYEQGLHISYNSDIVYAMYCTTNPNHIYAAPNKYYEAMLLGKPIITTKGTNVGDKVIQNDIGFIIDENKGHLIGLLKILEDKRTLCYEKGEKAISLWNSKYKNYTSNFLKSKYGCFLERSK